MSHSPFLRAARGLVLGAGASFAALSPVQAQDGLVAAAPNVEAVGTIIISDVGPGNLGTRLLNPRYDASAAQFSGVVRLGLRNAAGALAGSCSGSLLWTGAHILTAAHCVTNTSGTVVRPTADVLFQGPGGVTTTIQGTVTAVKPGWSGQVGNDPNDLAIITLANAAPDVYQRYSIFSGNPLNQQTTLVGWGLKGDGILGQVGDFPQPVRLKGSNSWNVSRANDLFFTQLGDRGVLVYDFDNGTRQRNSLCNLFFLNNVPPSGAENSLCEAGYGLDEVALGQGDSGGAAFINGQIAGVASWVTTGLTTNNLGEVVVDPACINPNNPAQAGLSCFGAFGGHVFAGQASNLAFIQNSVVPEPSTYALMATGLAGLAAFARRRRAMQA